MPTDSAAHLAKLLREVADAHHDAFAATGGEDPEWPRWYAARVMPHLAGTEFLPTVAAESVHGSRSSRWPKPTGSQSRSSASRSFR